MKHTYVPMKVLGMPIDNATNGATADKVTVLAVAMAWMDMVETRASWIFDMVKR
jgi:hypothetical protein